MDSQTDGVTDWTKKKFQSSVWRVVLLCQFLVLAIMTGKKKVTVVCLAGCVVVSVFGSGDYNRKEKSYSHLSGELCCCVSFWFWRLRPEKKKLQSSVWRVVLLCQFSVLAITTGKKKDTVVSLACCAVVSVFGSGGK